MAIRDAEPMVDGDVIYRIMAERDMPGMLALLDEIRPGIMGLTTDAAYAALCRAGLDDEHLSIAVAECHGEIAAMFIVITEWQTFWLGFLTGHPVLGMQVLWSILRRRVRNHFRMASSPPQQQEGVEQWVASTPSGRTWSENGPGIAKGIFLGANPKFRGRRIGAKVYTYLIDALREAGYKRYDACVDLRNVVSLRLNHEAGVRMELSGTRYFGTMDL